jgi:prepilin-type N-terminal cleavage/methylation domain-containing protein
VLFEGVTVKKQETKRMNSRRSRNSERGFSLIELAVVTIIIVVISAIALIQINPSLQTARSDNALRVVLDQLRQAREYSITNRRYVQIAFSTLAGNPPQIVITQMNTLTTGAGTTNPVLSTVYVPPPMQYMVVGTMPDTPDGYGNGSAIAFEIEGTGTAPSGSMYFQSDGELIDSVTNNPIDGTIFLGVTGNKSSARAVTVMGSTGRVRGWRSTGTGTTPTGAWFSF